MINRAQLQFNLADTLELMSRTEEAIAEYLKIPLMYPNEQIWSVKAYLRVAKIYEEGQDWQGARVTYQKIIQLNTQEASYAQERLDWIKNNAWKMKDEWLICVGGDYDNCFFQCLGNFFKGGPMMWPIFLLSVIAITVGMKIFIFEFNRKKYKKIKTRLF